MTTPLTNWANNHIFTAAQIHRPETVAQVQELVAHASRIKVLGARHSFNNIADSPGELLSLERLDRIVSLDRERSTVTIEGGVRYGPLARYLHQAGYALHNLASLPHVTVAGACATATHGSGLGNGNLATVVSALEIVRADGEIVKLSREQDGEQFLGAVVSLGGLGAITQLTLDVVPTFEMQQYVYEHLPLAQLEGHLDAILGCAYSVSLFTDWHGANFNQVWVKQRVTDETSVEAGAELFQAKLATRPLHPIAELSAENCTEQMGVPGPWHERLPHFRMDFTPSSGEELQSEYFVPRSHALAALQAIYKIHEHIAPLLLISEIRTIAADTLWMSPCYGQDCLAIHFTWKKDWPAVQKLLPLIETQLAPFAARPHWGKLFTMQAEQLQTRYQKLPDFRRLLESYDPQGKFRNEFLERYIFSEPTPPGAKAPG